MYLHRPGLSIPFRRLSRGSVTTLKKRVLTYYRKLKATRSDLAKLRKLVDTLPVGIHSLNRKGIITDINSTEAEMLGYTKDEILRNEMSFLDFIPEDQKEEAWQRFQQKLNGNSVEKIIHRTYVRKDGSHIFVTSEDRPLKNEQGAVVGLVTVLINITELNRVQDQAAQAKKLQALGQMAAGVAHHFGNIFGVISICAELAMRQSPNDDSVITIFYECSRAKEIINSVLHYTQKALFLRIMTFDPLDVIRGIIEDMEQQSAEKGISINKRYISTSNIKADPGQIDKLIRNLFQNSLKATPKGGSITFIIDVRDFQEWQTSVSGRPLEPGKYVLICIEDTGPGIPPEIREKVFDPFFSTDDTSHPGLGLSEALGIAESIGGGIKLSKINQGTKISVFLPICSN